MDHSSSESESSQEKGTSVPRLFMWLLSQVIIQLFWENFQWHWCGTVNLSL